MGPEFTFFGGILLGLVSSLHCAAMCGPVAASMLFVGGRQTTPRERLALVLSAQAGKAVSYCVAAAALGAVGSGIYGVLDRGDAFRFLQVLTAGWLVLVGAWLAGVIRVDAAACCHGLVSRAAMGFSGRVASFALAAGPETVHRRGGTFAFTYGIAWGAVPCGFVYAALMTAALTGSVGGAVSVMAGFALGTMPAVTVAALGISSLRSGLASPRARRAGGALIAAVGLGGLILTGPGGFNCL